MRKVHNLTRAKERMSMQGEWGEEAGPLWLMKLDQPSVAPKRKKWLLIH